MKTSDLKKDITVSVRINSQVKEKLLKTGVTLQNIIDSYVDKNFDLDIKKTPKKASA